MKIEHVAIWCVDLERQKTFYETYFGSTSGSRYFNPVKNFRSYFLTFDEGCRLELMHMPSIPVSLNEVMKQFTGLTHMAISVGTREKVDELPERLRTDGYSIVGEPRTTGDGYYESVILDPEGNRIEITI